MLRLGQQEPIRPSGNDCATWALNLQYRSLQTPEAPQRL